MSFTLATLKTAVQDYLQVSESTFTSQLNTFITESEDRILVWFSCLGKGKTSRARLHRVTDF